MINNNHPITPPPELIAQWGKEAPMFRDAGVTRERYMTTQAARWGADAELDACVKWLKEQRWEALAIHLRSARRPKPPSLKEQGREALQNIHAAVVMETGGRELDVLKEIVESLPD